MRFLTCIPSPFYLSLEALSLGLFSHSSVYDQSSPVVNLRKTTITTSIHWNSPHIRRYKDDTSSNKPKLKWHWLLRHSKTWLQHHSCTPVTVTHPRGLQTTASPNSNAASGFISWFWCLYWPVSPSNRRTIRDGRLQYSWNRENGWLHGASPVVQFKPAVSWLMNGRLSGCPFRCSLDVWGNSEMDP